MWVLVAALVLAGCSGGFGGLSVGAHTEREAGSMYLWSQRGADAGELARAYCLLGGPRERAWMRDAFEHHAVPAIVRITCPE